MHRIKTKFRQLAQKQAKALVTFVTAGDPEPQIFRDLLAQLPQAGADIIEIGMPFSDPMADGPEIQLANQRALAHDVHPAMILSMVADFRKQDNVTPIVLMGYFNPVRHHGLSAFVTEAVNAGVDGLILVDLPPEEEQLRTLCQQAGLDLIRLVSPMTDDLRLAQITRNVTGLIYAISVTGITGFKSADPDTVKRYIARVKKASASDLPVVVGFGIDSPEKAQAIYPVADGIVVGSALVKTIRLAVEQHLAGDLIVKNLIKQVKALRAVQC